MIPWAKPYLFGDEDKFVLDALKSTWISGGKYVDKFEKEFSRFIGTKYAVTTSNGTTALHLALLGLGIGNCDEVIIPGFTFVAPANTVIYTGAKPVFVDIDPKTWCIDANDIEKSISKKTKAIIPVHVYGNACDMDKITEIANSNEIFVIEDVAEAIFSKFDEKFVGSLGTVGCFSFQATKTITTGEGGAVLTNDKKLDERMRILHSHGMRQGKRYWHDFIGYNYRLTNMQAAMGCAQLDRADVIIREKKRVYKRYLRNLSNIKGIYFQKIKNKTDAVI
ncbi:MAG: DegT/DnrJ/EryC1/StrS family aminotransferase, partial [Candidatus Thermoplasmatota archaeon]|nr:DegT/DnrJ/EryC1/StrS family aminotransferase [Candidatus Thermoplasmatota archaeon]